MDGAELDRSPWPGDSVNVFTEYGDLDDFDTQETVNLAVVANGTDWEMTFELIYENSSRTAFEIGAGNSTTLLGGHELDGQTNYTVRVFRAKGPHGEWRWQAVRTVDQGFYATGPNPENKTVFIYKNSIGFNLNADVAGSDLISQMNDFCIAGPPNDDDINPDDSRINFETFSAGEDCPYPHVVPGIPHTHAGQSRSFGYFGEIQWCETKGAANWEAAVEAEYKDSLDTFEQTDLTPTWGGAICWFLPDGSTNDFSHSDTICHKHDDDTTPCYGNGYGYHGYSYNSVGDNHDFTEYQKNVKDDHYHAQKHHTWDNPHNYQVLHLKCERDSAGGDCGQGDQPGHFCGCKSVATNRGYGDLTSPHEFGHNYGALHSDSRCIDGEPSVMMEPEQADDSGDTCYSGENNIPQFSWVNEDNVNSNV